MNRSEISVWHTAAKFPITDEVLENRCIALNAILSENDNAYWIDVVKLFLGLQPNPTTEASFVKELQDNDETFPRLKIEKQVVVQAAIALSCKIQLALDFMNGVKPTPVKAATAATEGENSEEEEVTEDAEPGEEDVEIARIICSAIENATFQKQIKVETKVGLLDKIREFRTQFKSSDRELDNENHSELLGEIETRLSEEEEPMDAAEQIKLTKALRSQIRTNDIHGEELNILWWLFGEYSEIANDYFGNINQNTLAVIVAREMHDLSSFNTEMPAARHIIRKALSIGRKPSETAVTTIKSCLDAVGPDQKKKIIGNYEASICELTPCLNALKLGKDFSGGKDAKSKAEENLTHDAIALQIYRELNFLSAI